MGLWDWIKIAVSYAMDGPFEAAVIRKKLNNSFQNNFDNGVADNTNMKPRPIGKNKWLHSGDDFGKMEPGISEPYFPITKKKNDEL